MNVVRDKVVSIHYTPQDDSGAVLDSSSGGDPLAYLHGQGNIVPGLEKALEGRQVGDKLDVRVTPAEGYGVRDEKLGAAACRGARSAASRRSSPACSSTRRTRTGQPQVITRQARQGRHGHDRRQPSARGRAPELRGRDHRHPRADVRGNRARSRARPGRTSPPRLTPCGSGRCGRLRDGGGATGGSLNALPSALSSGGSRP